MTDEDARLFAMGWIRIQCDNSTAMMPEHLDRVFVLGDARRGNPVRGFRYVDQLYYDSQYGFVANNGDDDAYGGLTHWMQSRVGERLLHHLTFPDDKQSMMMNPTDAYRHHKFFLEDDGFIAQQEEAMSSLNAVETKVSSS